jgi:hypothetical protein
MVGLTASLISVLERELVKRKGREDKRTASEFSFDWLSFVFV